MTDEQAEQRLANINDPAWDDTLTQAVARLSDALGEFCRGVVEAFQPIAKVFIDVSQQMYDGLHDVYVTEGAIYGDTHEGMMRWLEEKGEIARHEAEAQRQRDLHWDLADLKRRRG